MCTQDIQRMGDANPIFIRRDKFKEQITFSTTSLMGGRPMRLSSAFKKTQVKFGVMDNHFGGAQKIAQPLGNVGKLLFIGKESVIQP